MWKFLSYWICIPLLCLGILGCEGTSDVSSTETGSSQSMAAGDGTELLATPFNVDFYGFTVDEELTPGDVVTAYDTDGVLCGKTTVKDQGQYGFIHVYGDDPHTPDVDEGAVEGDVITFEVNGVPVRSVGPDEAEWTTPGDRWHVDLSMVETPSS